MYIIIWKTLCSQQFCSAALCPDPVDINNGMVTFTGTSVGDTATYSCDLHFDLVGDATTTCTQVDSKNTAFLPAPPVCMREFCIIITIEWLHNQFECGCVAQIISPGKAVWHTSTVAVLLGSYNY